MQSAVTKTSIIIKLDENLSEEFICDTAESGELFIGQTCGYPLVMQNFENLNVVAVPIHDFDGCQGPLYSSVLIARKNTKKENLRGKTKAVSSIFSMSGNVFLFSSLGSDLGIG